MDGESRSDCVFASPRRAFVIFDTVSRSKSCFCGWSGTNWGFGWYLSRICLADWVRNPWQPRRADHTASSQPAPRQSFAYRRLGIAPAFGWKNPRGPAANRPAAVFRERSGNPQRAALPNPRVLTAPGCYTCPLSTQHHGPDVIRASHVALHWHPNTLS